MPSISISSDTHFRTCAAMLLIAVDVAATAGLCSAAPASQPLPDYARADAQTIKAHTQEIVSSPRFAQRITLRQWLLEKLSRWGRPRVHLPEPVTSFFSTAITVWCLLTLLAILVHLAWTIWLLARPSRTRTGGSGRGSGPREVTCPEELWQQSQRLAQSGEFRVAVGVLLVAVLRQLEAMKVLSFHKSKTNGEYVREYPGHLGGRREFVQFVATFERNIYGGLEIHGQTYDAMNSLAKRIIGDVSQNA